MDIETIFSLMDKAEKSSFSKISIETQDVKLSMERMSEGAIASPAAPLLKEKATAKHEYESENIVFAPISGVFYVAKEPGAEPFVKEGSKVNKGDVLCIIEAMKTMNEIIATKSGVIESVLKKDAEAVVAKDALFVFVR